MQTETKKIRILLVDDHALFREGLARLLSAEPDFEIINGCASTREALAIIDATEVDVVLLDLDLGGERGAAFLRLASERGFRGRILIVTAALDDPEAARLLSEGAAGIFLKHNPPALLSVSIRTVMSGQDWLDQRYIQALVRREPPPEREYRKPKLSERERAVMAGVLKGLTNKEIGEQLQASESSVKASVQHLFEKTGVRSRSQLVRIALEQYRDEL